MFINLNPTNKILSWKNGDILNTKVLYLTTQKFHKNNFTGKIEVIFNFFTVLYMPHKWFFSSINTLFSKTVFLNNCTRLHTPLHKYLLENVTDNCTVRNGRTPVKEYTLRPTSWNIYLAIMKWNPSEHSSCASFTRNTDLSVKCQME